MAVVRISDELISNVRNNARNSLTAMKVAASKQLPTSVMDGIYDRTIGMYEADIKRLPSWMFVPWGGLDLEVLNTPSKVTAYIIVKGSQTVPFTTPRLMPPPDSFGRATGKLQRNGNYGSGMKYTLTPGDLFDDDLLAMVNKRNEDMMRAEKMAGDLADGLESVLKKFTTLAPALKACPALWDFLPDEIKERHKTIKEKTAASKPDLSGLDTNRIVSLAAIAKMVK